jgi:hypothetical protein
MDFKLNSNSKTIYYSSFFILFFINLFLKIQDLGAQPLWFDESISVKATLLHFGHIKHISEWDNNPPFYYYCLWVWTKIFGISEFAVRSLSVVLMSLSASLLFVLLKKNSNYLISLSASLLFTFNDYIFQYSQEARAYSLVVMLVILSSIIFFNLINKYNVWNILLLGLINFLIIYTHYIAGLVLLFQLLFIVFFYRNILKQFLLSILLTFGFILLRFTKKQVLNILSFNGAGKTFWLRKSDVQGLWETLQLFFGGQIMCYVLLTLLFCAFIFFFTRRKKEISTQNDLIIYSMLMGPVMILFLYFLGYLKPIFLDRYLIFTIPFLFIIVAYFICTVNKWFPSILLLIFFLQIITSRYNIPKSMNYSYAAEIVKKLRVIDPNALVILQTKDITGLFTYYYNRDLFLDQENLISSLNKLNIYDINNATDLNYLNFKNFRSIILCQTFETERDHKEILKLMADNSFKVLTYHFVRGVNISVIKKVN